jgi:hypothetical protein
MIQVQVLPRLCGGEGRSGSAALPRAEAQLSVNALASRRRAPRAVLRRREDLVEVGYPKEVVHVSSARKERARRPLHVRASDLPLAPQGVESMYVIPSAKG